MTDKKKIIRITTVPSSLRTLLKGQLKFMSEHYGILGIASPGPELEEVNRNEGIEVEAVKMTRSITPLADLVSTWKLYKIIRREQPFIVHTHTPKAGTLGMLAARLAGVPHRIHTIAGLPLLEATGLKRKLLNAVERFTYGNATKVLPNSFGMDRIVKEAKFGPDHKFTVIGNGSSNGIDTDHYSPSTVSEDTKEKLRLDLGIERDDMVFIFIGRMVKDKGVNELVQAFNDLSHNNPKAKLILVGPHENHLDPLDPFTEELMEKNQNILPVGLQMEIRPYVAISDVLVHVSYREGFPNVVLQAGSMGLACIVSDINGCNEIITHDENGLIVPPKDVEAVKKAMLFCIEHPSEVRRLALGSRKRIVSLYKREYLWNELLTFYNGLS